MLPGSVKYSEQGSQFVEFGLVLIPLLLFAAFALDLGWLFFAKSSLQYAVFAGTRFAITGQTLNGYSGQDNSIRAVVQQNAFSFLNGTSGLNAISINYYSPQDLSTPLYGIGSNAGGNVVTVSISNYPVAMLIPGLISTANLNKLSAFSTDVLEASPNGIPPTR